MVGPDVLVILDGASEPWDGRRVTSLERARTPALDALAATGRLTRLRTVPAGLPAGSETAIPVLLGWTPTAPVDRAALEAAARGIAIPVECSAWRIDVLGNGSRAGDPATARAASQLRAAAPGHTVHRLTGHRLLLIGPEPLPDAARLAHLRVWPRGGGLPRILDKRTVVIAAHGAAAGVAAQLGARVIVPAGATGDTTTDLDAKLRAARTAGDPRVVVHVGGADEAAHQRDARGKVAFIERVDRDLIAPLARLAGTLCVSPDHGCDPATGAHDADPVPYLRWEAGRPRASGHHRFTERAAAGLAVEETLDS